MDVRVLSTLRLYPGVSDVKSILYHVEFTVLYFVIYAQSPELTRGPPELVHHFRL
jgi:hypothetical protein